MLTGHQTPYPEGLAGQKYLPSRTSVRASPFNLVANTINRLQPFFTAAHIDDLAPQILDMTVDSAVADNAVIHVENVHQLVSGEHPPRLRGERREQAKLDRCEPERFSCAQ